MFFDRIWQIYCQRTLFLVFNHVLLQNYNLYLMFCLLKIGFEAVGSRKFTTDVGWGCMIRSCQMLLAQVSLCNDFPLVLIDFVTS